MNEHLKDVCKDMAEVRKRCLADQISSEHADAAARAGFAAVKAEEVALHQALNSPAVEAQKPALAA
jgi:hypothetical protein